jgi:predicted GIY-YIG superfamily endonuclease
VTWWRSLSVLLCLLTALVSPRTASGASAVQAENRVKGFFLVATALVGASSARSVEKHPGNAAAYDENASGSVLAAEGVAAKFAADAAPTFSTYVYRLVDDAGEAVYYGITNDPARRLAEHAAEQAFPFNGMQVISEAQPLAQARALESSLIQQAVAEGRTIYNVATNSISPLIPVLVPPTVVPGQTLLNPWLYGGF